MQQSCKNVLLICFLTLVCSFSSWSQYTPYFQNFDVSQYNAGNQNWDISKADDGRVYVANNNGLLEYDGLNWELHTIPNKTTLRSVLAHQNKIFVGSYEEFGFFKANTSGELVYTSLSERLDDNDFLNEEFWEILAVGNQIIFRSFQNIYSFSDDKISKITPNSTLISCDVVDGILYISTLREGIFKLSNSELISVIDDLALEGERVISISKKENEVLITTALKGNFLFDGLNLKPWNTEVNELIKKYQLNAFSESKSGKMVFGTIQNGIYLTDNSGSIISHINRENGLINNTVLGQYLSSDNQLWVGFDNGLSVIDLKSKSSFYNDVTGKLGAVYDVATYKSRIYIGSNTGLYYLDKKNELQFVEGSQGQVWDLKVVEGDLFCGHNNGTYLVRGDQLELISAQTGGWVIQKVPEETATYIQGTYAGLVKFKKVNGNWQSNYMGKTTIPIRFLVFESPEVAWAAHAYKGLYKIRFDSNHDSILSIENYDKKGLSSTYNLRVHKVKNNICIKTNEGWQKYEPLLDSIVPYNLLNEAFGKDSYIISDEETNLLALKSDDIITLKSLDSYNNDILLGSNYIKERLIFGYENISKIDEGRLALNLNDGFMVIDKSAKQMDSQIFKPQIDEIRLDGKTKAINDKGIMKIPNRYKNLMIHLSSPRSSNYYFEYAMANIDSSHYYKIDNGKLELSNLGYGDYLLKIRTKNDYNKTSGEISLQLNVLPPWYKSQKGFMIYGILVILFILVIYYLHKQKVNKEQFLLKLRYDEEQEKLLREKTVENDKRIVELKNESLENEVKLKSKQLANTAMALVKKNETLLELKSELVVHKSAFDNYYAYKKLIKKIDGSIGHEDEWAIFEHNFNQVHEKFFNKLKKKHPNLTPKDLKVCAYIKMDLTTKEIAPLMNVSVRGVETQRYRLKQKLDLESDNSVTDYVRNF